MKHTATYKGRKVTVRLRSGLVFTDRFMERTRSKQILFESGRRVHVRDVVGFYAGVNVARACGGV